MRAILTAAFMFGFAFPAGASDRFTAEFSEVAVDMAAWKDVVEATAAEMKTAYSATSISAHWYNRFRMTYARLSRSYNALIDRVVLDMDEASRVESAGEYIELLSRVQNETDLLVGPSAQWIAPLFTDDREVQLGAVATDITEKVNAVASAIELIATYQDDLDADGWSDAYALAVEGLRGAKLLDFGEVPQGEPR